MARNIAEKELKDISATSGPLPTLNKRLSSTKNYEEIPSDSESFTSAISQTTTSSSKKKKKKSLLTDTSYRLGGKTHHATSIAYTYQRKFKKPAPISIKKLLKDSDLDLNSEAAKQMLQAAGLNEDLHQNQTDAPLTTLDTPHSHSMEDLVSTQTVSQQDLDSENTEQSIDQPSTSYKDSGPLSLSSLYSFLVDSGEFSTLSEFLKSTIFTSLKKAIRQKRKKPQTIEVTRTDKLNKKIEDLHSSLESISRKINIISSNQEAVLRNSGHSQQEIQNVPIPQVPTYSEVLSRPKSTLILRRQSEDIKLDVVKDRVNQLVRAKNLKVTKFNTNNNNLEIRFSSEQEMELFKNDLRDEEQFKDKLTVNNKEPRKQQLIIFNLEDNIPEDELLENISHNLAEVGRTDLEIKKKIKGRKPNTHHLVIRLNRLQASKLIKLGFIFIGVQKKWLRPYISILRCTNCQNFGHLSFNCRERTNCSICANGHHFMECTATRDRCYNCIRSNHELNTTYDTNHQATDPNCYSFREYAFVLRNRQPTRPLPRYV